MAYDEGMAARIRQLLLDEPGVSEKKMFGGLAFMVNGNMAVAASSKGSVMLRRDPGREGPGGEQERAEPQGRKLMGAFLQIDAEGTESDEQLADIVERGVGYARTLPPK